MHVHEILSLATRVRRLLVRDAADRSTQLSERYFRLIVGKTVREVHEYVDQAVAHVEEVVRLPVIAHSRGEQRIEDGLPCRERLRADDVGDGVPELTKRCERAFTIGDVTRVARGKHEDLATVPFGGKER